MSNQDEIENLRELLATHRATLQLLLGQYARFGAAYVPQHIWHGLRDTRAEIKRCKAALHALGAPAEAQPYDESADESTLPQQAGAGLTALADLIQSPAARSAIAIYRATFEATSRQIALLGGYKHLHDQFQQLEDRHAILAHCCKALPNDPTSWYDAEENEPELYDKAAELISDAASSILSEETSTWTPRLMRAQHDLRASLEAQNADGLREALRRIKEIIGRQLSRTNLRLASVAEALQLAGLIGALQQIGEWLGQASSADQGRLADLRRGAAALGDLDRRLAQSVSLHRAFQDFDDELRRIEGVLDHIESELNDSWPDLVLLMRSICAQAQTEWAARLSALGADVEQFLLNGEPIKLRRAFGRYRSHATICFNRIDFDLRNLCAELQQIGAPLDHVLQVLG